MLRDKILSSSLTPGSLLCGNCTGSSELISNTILRQLIAHIVLHLAGLVTEAPGTLLNG